MRFRLWYDVVWLEMVRGSLWPGFKKMPLSQLSFVNLVTTQTQHSCFTGFPLESKPKAQHYTSTRLTDCNMINYISVFLSFFPPFSLFHTLFQSSEPCVLVGVVNLPWYSKLNILVTSVQPGGNPPCFPFLLLFFFPLCNDSLLVGLWAQFSHLVSVLSLSYPVSWLQMWWMMF